MTQETTQIEPEPAHRDAELPYPLSWFDRLLAWVEDLPGPVWLAYLLTILIVALYINVLFWIEGSRSIGEIDPETSFAVFFVYWPALYHYLTRIGSRALRSYRPLLDVGDQEIARIDYELATLPRTIGWWAIPFGYGFAALQVFGEAPYGEVNLQTVLPYAGDIAITGFVVAAFYCLLIRSIRQLRMVRRLHAQAVNINLLELGPAHAFSDLTARTGAGVILLLIVGYIAQPPDFTDLADLLLSGTTIVLAIGIFTIPIMGIQGRIEQEKGRALHEVNSLLQSASDRLHNRVRGENYQDMAQTSDAIEALIRERELFKSVSTWPWDPRTLRGFASALLLPIFLWLVTRLLERVL